MTSRFPMRTRATLANATSGSNGQLEVTSQLKHLFSCKFWSTQLDQQDIDHFNGEFISSNAHVGIVYSRSGFNARAIEKAGALRFHCCKLYSNAPAELPQQLELGLAYHIAPRFSLSLDRPLPSTKFGTWNDVFDLMIEERSVREVLVEILDQYQDCSYLIERWDQAVKSRGFAIDLATSVDAPNRLIIEVRDRVRRAKIEYVLLNGSYNFTSGQFLGSQTTPSIDTWNVDPGPGWEEIEQPPEQTPKQLILCLMRCNSASAVGECGALRLPAQE